MYEKQTSLNLRTGVGIDLSNKVAETRKNIQAIMTATYMYGT